MYHYYKYQQYPVGSYEFYVEIGNRQIGFEKIRGIDLVNQTPFVSSNEILGKNEPEYASASLRGTEEDSPQGTQQRKRTLTLEKAILAVSDESKEKEDQTYLFSLLKEGVRIEKITILIPTGKQLQSAWLLLNFTDCYLTAYTLSELDASRTNYLRQQLSFSYRDVTIDW